MPQLIVRKLEATARSIYLNYNVRSAVFVYAKIDKTLEFLQGYPRHLETWRAWKGTPFLPMADSNHSRWFAEEIQPYEPSLRAYLSRRFPTVRDHDDLIQDTFVRTLRVRERGRLDHIKAYLFATVRNAAIDWLRRHRRETRDLTGLSDDMHVLDEKPGVRDELERRQEFEAVVEAVMALPGRCRDVMVLRFLEGFKTCEIAERLEISTETVRVQLFKGIRTCTANLGRRGFLEHRGVACESP